MVKYLPIIVSHMLIIKYLAIILSHMLKKTLSLVYNLLSYPYYLCS